VAAFTNAPHTETPPRGRPPCRGDRLRRRPAATDRNYWCTATDAGSVHERRTWSGDDARAWRAWERYEDGVGVDAHCALQDRDQRLPDRITRRARPVAVGLGRPSERPDAPSGRRSKRRGCNRFRTAGSPIPPHSCPARQPAVALIAAMQTLPPKQRARPDPATSWGSVPRCGRQLDTSVRGEQRTATGQSRVSAADEIVETGRQHREGQIDRYIRRSSRGRCDTGQPATEDAILEMPRCTVGSGRVNYGRFIERVYAKRGTAWRCSRSRPTPARGGRLLPGRHRQYRCTPLQVFTVRRRHLTRRRVPGSGGVTAFGLAHTSITLTNGALIEQRKMHGRHPPTAPW